MNTNLRHTHQLLAAALITILAVSIVKPVLAQEDGPLIRITQVDNSQFPEVTVYVSVTNAAGEPVAVDSKKIQLSENDIPMTVEYAGEAGEIGPLTTMLVMDVSGSMLQAGKLKGAKNAAIEYVKQMRPGDQAGLMTFNTVVKYVHPLTTDTEQLSIAIANLNAYEDTAMYDALAQASQILKEIPGRKAIIVLTDGLDNVSKSKPDQVIESIGPAGLTISTIGLGDPEKTGQNSGLDEETLRSFSDLAGGIYSYANDAETLQNLYKLYSRALQSEYRIIYTSPSTLRDGANRTLNVSLLEAGGAASSSMQVQYNPGGVLPEVNRSISWSLFAGMLAFLLLLLFVPLTLSNFYRQKTSSPTDVTTAPVKKANIKLK